jgi:lipoprotein-anchoring transpeptidase ErfK/SrfK
MALVIALAFGNQARAEDVMASLPDGPPGGEVAAPRTISVVARIDLSEQQMYVYVDDQFAYQWPVSTARARYVTPLGFYSAEWLSRYHRSRKYDWAPMPYSVFFHKGYAIHGTTEIKRLGTPASHGCVRLHPENAKIFFNLVKERGLEATLISVVR